MRFLHWQVDIPDGRAVRVDLSGTEANVRIMDWTNFSSFKSGRQHRFYGGHYRRSPAIIKPPSSGEWYVVVDLGGYGGNIDATVSIV